MSASTKIHSTTAFTIIKINVTCAPNQYIKMISDINFTVQRNPYRLRDRLNFCLNGR